MGSLEEAEKRLAPATSPPVGKMWILVDNVIEILVGPRQGMGYVAVADVQGAVIGWMEESSNGPRFEPAMAGDLQGPVTQRDMVWMWRGLVQQGEGLDVWELHLTSPSGKKKERGELWTIFHSQMCLYS